MRSHRTLSLCRSALVLLVCAAVLVADAGPDAVRQKKDDKGKRPRTEDEDDNPPKTKPPEPKKPSKRDEDEDSRGKVTNPGVLRFDDEDGHPPAAPKGGDVD